VTGPRLIVGIGPGDADGVPAAALARLSREGPVHALAVDEGAAAVIGQAVESVAPVDVPPDGAVIAAPDAVAHRLARANPAAAAWPSRDALRDRAIGAEVAALARVGGHLRRECPWDREQTAASIVPHTIEEAFEVAEAVASGYGLPDELGDLLFQAVFLSQFLEEEGVADLASVARGQADKLISRHPHVYGDAVAATAAGVVDVWESRKRAERAGQGIFHDLPAGLPALAYATKAQKRAAAVGFTFPDAAAAGLSLREELAELDADPGDRELGDVLFAVVAVARMLDVDPELALRASARRFRGRVERAAALAAAAGRAFEALPPEEQLDWYRRAHAEGVT
jgi:MazG family protein